MSRRQLNERGIKAGTSVWWDGQCVTVTLPTTTFYLTMQEARLFGEEVLNKLLSAGQHTHVAVAGGVLSLEEASFLADRLQTLAGSRSPRPVPSRCRRRNTRSKVADKVDWAKEGF